MDKLQVIEELNNIGEKIKEVRDNQEVVKCADESCMCVEFDNLLDDLQTIKDRLLKTKSEIPVRIFKINERCMTKEGGDYNGIRTVLISGKDISYKPADAKRVNDNFEGECLDSYIDDIECIV